MSRITLTFNFEVLTYVLYKVKTNFDMLKEASKINLFDRLFVQGVTYLNVQVELICKSFCLTKLLLVKQP